ncbi:MAG: 1-acyl-sn-glycerol-3-phosphate acyltransferase [Gammaproteobacteria bacterium]|nr:MAG: 1-acyl-sn-glycerol-3-phosphate acyltransferase [Gammaproteobacteria bacterium]
MRRPAGPGVWLRSLLFWLLFVGALVIIAPVVLLSFPFPYPVRYRLATRWGRFAIWALRRVCRLDYRVTGREHLPDEPAIVFAKHQSAWETLALQEIFPPQVWVLKRELMWIPLFGWGMALLEPIPLDRRAGRRAVLKLVREGIDRLRKGRWVVVFPEGTRVPPCTRGRYHIGGAVLAEKSGAPVVPVAHNAGEFWPKHSLLKYPGTIDVVIGPPIATRGKRAAQILAEAEAWIEATMERISHCPR